MKCPKCGYLGFESVDRCRNCGYDFSLANLDDLDVPELPIRRTEWKALPDDLDLTQPAAAPESPPTPVRTTAPAPSRDVPAAAARPVTPAPRVAAAVVPPSAELPLFAPASGDVESPGGTGVPSPGRTRAPHDADDEPLIKRASAPRQPLSVRRATPEVPRLRPEPPRTGSLDLSLDGGSSAAESGASARKGGDAWGAVDDHEAADAALGARLAAVVIDGLVLAIIDALVIYFTLQICGITAAEWVLLPKGPLLAFLVIQNGGYLVSFTAGGQTLGKMAAGIRVISADGAPLDLGRATVRTFFWTLLAVPAGLGFLTAAFSRDHRGLHDRVASTRVVRTA